MSNARGGKRKSWRRLHVRLSWPCPLCGASVRDRRADEVAQRRARGPLEARAIRVGNEFGSPCKACRDACDPRLMGVVR